jgi:hypothetical protein
MRDQRQRLRIVNDDCVAIFEMEPGCILQHDLFVYGSLCFRQTQVLTLQGVVQLLCAAEKPGCSLDEMPIRVDAHRIHHQRQGREQFGDAAAVECGTDVGDTHPADTISLPRYPFRDRRADQGFVLFDRMKAKLGPLNSGVKSRHRGCMQFHCATLSASPPLMISNRLFPRRQP